MGRALRSHGPGISAPVIFVWALAQPIAAVAQGIAPDGGTATSVSGGASGKQTVQIAPVGASGISHNTYTHFNVRPAGADILNTGVNARLIVNEVTSTNPSLLQGQIAVVGPRAHFILANPNGITADGASFVNTGNVALSTGRVSFADFQTSSGTMQRNVVLTTSAGDIVVGDHGLAGAFNSLELIAKQIRVTGKLQNDNTSAGRIQLTAGETRAEINTGVNVADPLTPWVQYQASGATSTTLAVDITPLGSLTAGRVQIIVADGGAGVRHAGAALATAGDFAISGSGHLELAGGNIRSGGDVVLEAAAAHFHSGAGGDVSTVTADGSIELRIGQGRFQSGRLNAGTAGRVGNVTVGVPAASASGPLRLSHEIIGNALTPFTIAATGGIGLNSIGQTLELDAAQVFAQQSILLDANDVRLGTAWQGGAPFGAQLRSSAGEIRINATGTAESVGGSVRGARGIVVQASNLQLLPAIQADRIEESAWLSDAAGIDLTVANGIHLVASDVIAQTDIVARATSFTLEADAIMGRRSSVVATTGGLLLDLAGDLHNSASLLQGSMRIVGNPASLGAVAVVAGGDIRNIATATDRVGVIFGVDDDVDLRAGGSVLNHTARIVSNRNLTVHAGGDVRSIIDKLAGANGEARSAYSRRESGFLFFSRKVSGYDQDFGSLLIPNQLAYLIADGNLTIEARNIFLRGAEVDANAGNVVLHASQSINNEAVRTGKLHYESSCLFACRRSASASVQLAGGLINASNDVRMTAGTEIVNTGGRVLALNEIVLDTPTVTARSLATYSALDVNPNIGVSWGRIYAADQGGSFTANRGRLSVNGAVVIDGGGLTAANGVTVRDGTTTVHQASREPVTIDSHVGIFNWLW